MTPVEYVIALLDADPQGWAMEGEYNLGHKRANLLIWISNGAFGLEVVGDIRLSKSAMGFFERRRLWKAVKRQQAAALAQKLLEACESM